jgi:hypothetical protein
MGFVAMQVRNGEIEEAYQGQVREAAGKYGERRRVGRACVG